jgi:phage N-6-adenine-methyltransferase
MSLKLGDIDLSAVTARAAAMRLKGLYSSEDSDWRTPSPLFWKLHREFQFNLDLAADAVNHLLPLYLGPGSTVLEDALTPRDWAWPPAGKHEAPGPTYVGPPAHTQPRSNTRGFLNPPYSRRRKLSIDPWLERCARTKDGGGLVVAIVPARTDTDWWHEHVMRATEIRLVRGRIHFDPSPTWREANPTKRSSGNFPSAVVIWDGRGSKSDRPPYVCSWDWR